MTEFPSSPEPLPAPGFFRDMWALVSGHISTSRQAWLSVLLWLGIVACLLPAALAFSQKLQGTVAGIDGSPTEVVRKNLVKNFSTALAFPTALIWDARGIPPDQAEAAWQQALTALGQEETVSEVDDGRSLIEPWPHAGWYAAFIALKADDYARAEKGIKPIRSCLAALTFPGPNRPLVTGGPALFYDLNLASTAALRRGEMIAMPVAFLILLLVFRSLVAALLPVVIAMIGVICTLGLLSLVAVFLPVTFFVPNLVTMIGLGVGIDYCLILLDRFRRERSALGLIEALTKARATAGRTVFLSAIMVVCGFISLLIVPLELFPSIALGGMLVVIVVGLASLTLLPSVIFLLGDKLEWGSSWLLPVQRLQKKWDVCQRWGHFIVRYPRISLAAGLGLLSLLSLPFFWLRVSSIEVNTLPQQAESRRGYDSLVDNLGPGWMMPAIVLVQHPQDQVWMTPAGLAEEQSLTSQLAALPNTDRVVTINDTTGSRTAQQARMVLLTSSQDSSQEVFLLLSKTDPQSAEARTWLNQVQGVLTQAEKMDVGGSHFYLGGLPAVLLQVDQIILNAMPLVIGATLMTTFILLLVFMRSLVIPIKAILLNLLCVLAAYGFQVVFFQDQWGALLFHFLPTHGLNTVVLIICFCTLFGLSMDYEVFIISAIQENWLRDQKMEGAVSGALGRTAGIISSAALIMIAVFLSFASGDVLETQQLGIGLSFAVFLDATVIRLFLVPSIMVLSKGSGFWLPAWLDRRLPVLRH